MHQALRCPCPAATHGSEITSASATSVSSTHVARADKAYLSQFQAGRKPFAALEFKNVSVVEGDEFRAAILRDKEIFNAGMEDINARQLQKPSSTRTLLKHANVNIIATGVCLHTACSTGIVANLHYNAKAMKQMHGGL